ncbi:MAG: hypothetical protein DBX59_06685 [Bacillota bacterium]|nr:MAG: hypothetical protein DBX59_06685 [Bacillota bacterium]
MKRMLFSVFFDAFFSGFAAFLVLFVLLASFLSIPLAVTLAALLALAVAALCFYKLYGKREKTTLSLQENRKKENLMFYLGLRKETQKLFAAAFTALGKTAAATKKGVYVRENDAYVYPCFSFDGVKKDDLSRAYFLSGSKKAYVFAPEFSAEIRGFARAFGDKIELCGGDETYKLFKNADMLPAEALKENKLTFAEKMKELLKPVFSRRRAPKYFLFGLTFLLFSFLVPYKLYYILFGTVLTVFSVVCLFFAVPPQKSETELCK